MGGAGLVAMTGVTAGAYLVGTTLASIVALVFSGGLYTMVVSAEREGRTAQIADLFCGFRRFGAYALLWLCEVGVVLGVELLVILSARVLGGLALFVGLAGFCVIVWATVAWVYGVVLVSDRGMGGVEALRESMLMVRSVGWWATFGALIVLGIVFFLASLIIVFVSGRATGLGATLTVIFYIAAFPFSICYVAAMYLGSARAPATTSRFGVPEPPAPEAGRVGANDAYLPSAPMGSSAGEDAWRSAADPLAPPLVQALHAPAAGSAPPV
jgi:hypothetical protein